MTMANSDVRALDFRLKVNSSLALQFTISSVRVAAAWRGGPCSSPCRVRCIDARLNVSLVEEREVRCKLRNAAAVLETTWPALDL